MFSFSYFELPVWPLGAGERSLWPTVISVAYLSMLAATTSSCIPAAALSWFVPLATWLS